MLKTNDSQINDRFFYHSFPRRFSSEASLEIEKGLNILSSIRNIGFLLIPEITEWCEPLSDGSMSKPWKVIQKRCCFTELAPIELMQHSQNFGKFSFEYDIETFRILGGIPVFYLPRARHENAGLESLASALISRIGEIQVLLNRLSQIDDLVRNTENKNQFLGIQKDGKNSFLRTTITGAEDLLSLITKDTQPVSILRNALRVLSGYFYPAEDFQYTGLLAYYRQREWRFIANMSKDNVELTRDPDSNEIDKLIEIDHDFFCKELAFFSGLSRRIDQCKIFSMFENIPIYKYARRIIVPEEAMHEAKNIFSDKEDPIVVSINDI